MGKCVISLDAYLNIPNKHKTELFPSPIKIRAANGSDIDNQGECDITFRIGQEKFTLPFLVSKTLTQHIIVGYNFSKAFHIGTTWNRNDQMCLTKNGKVIATTVSDKAINTLVQCTEAITLPPFSNVLIKCKVPKVLKSKSFEKICLF